MTWVVEKHQAEPANMPKDAKTVTMTTTPISEWLGRSSAFIWRRLRLPEYWFGLKRVLMSP